MSTPSIPIPHNENERLAALSAYNILDTLPEKDFDELTLLASEICQTPIALISLLDGSRQWFKSRVGLGVDQTPKEQAFCAHTITTEGDLLIVPDARLDERFATNPLVTSDPNIVFYAGASLINEDGYALGTLCVIDREPKQLTEQQILSLKILAKQILTQLELRKKLAELEKANEVLLEANTFIQKFASTAAHDIKNPLTSMLLSSQALDLRLKKAGDEKSSILVDMNIVSTKRLLSLVEKMLEYSKSPSMLLTNQHTFDLSELLEKVTSMIQVPGNIKITLPPVAHLLSCSEVALEQIFLNLLSNAVRYNDKEDGTIRVLFRDDGRFYNFKVVDNGIGIAEQNLDKIFEKLFTLDITDRFDKKGTGIGLDTVRALVEKLKGTISVESTLGKGTTFLFSIKKNL